MATDLKVHVVRYSNKELSNFIPMDTVPRALLSQETWTRNKVVEVHVITRTQGFVATDALQLAHLMKQAGAPLDEAPLSLERRKADEQGQFTL